MVSTELTYSIIFLLKIFPAPDSSYLINKLIQSIKIKIEDTSSILIILN